MRRAGRSTAKAAADAGPATPQAPRLIQYGVIRQRIAGQSQDKYMLAREHLLALLAFGRQGADTSARRCSTVTSGASGTAGLFVPKPTPCLVTLRQCAPDLGAAVRQRPLEYAHGRWDHYSVVTRKRARRICWHVNAPRSRLFAPLPVSVQVLPHRVTRVLPGALGFVIVLAEIIRGHVPGVYRSDEVRDVADAQQRRPRDFPPGPPDRCSP